MSLEIEMPFGCEVNECTAEPFFYNVKLTQPLFFLSCEINMNIENNETLFLVLQTFTQLLMVLGKFSS